MEGHDSQTLDQLISVKISADKLEAYIQFRNKPDGIQLNPADLELLLRQHGVIYGIRKDVLARIAANPAQYRSELVIVARGMAPQNGQDGTIRLLYDLDREMSGPAQLEDGKVDYREIRKLNNVHKGQPIARKVPPTPGVPGIAVTGEEIPAQSGREAVFKLGRNVVVDPENTTIYAAIDGLVTRTERDMINVFPVYEVNGDVDYSVGNIDFVGTVVIRGNVLPGFKVKAAGDIRVIGGVEAGELTAEGSIEITGGILGQQKGIVKAGQHVKSSFVQDACVIANEDVIVSQSIMHSQVRAGRQVICHGPKGLIVGGVIQAGEKVKARTIGNTMSTNTVIEVGLHPQLREELSELHSKLKTAQENLDKTDKALALLDQLSASGQLDQEKLGLRVRLNNTRKVTANEIGALKERMLEIEKKLEEAEKAEVEVTSTIYSGTKIVIGRYVRYVKDPVRMVKFRISEGEIKMLTNQ